MKKFNWKKDVTYNPEAKRSFHATARSRLRQLAKKMNFKGSDYTIRSNMAGPAVSGEIILHHNKVYVQISQGFPGILVRSCEGQKDYTGGHNFWVPFETLDNLSRLAEEVKRIIILGEVIEKITKEKTNSIMATIDPSWGEF